MIQTCSSKHQSRDINSVVIDTNFLSKEADWSFVVNFTSSEWWTIGILCQTVWFHHIWSHASMGDFNQLKSGALKAYSLFHIHINSISTISSSRSLWDTTSKFCPNLLPPRPHAVDNYSKKFLIHLRNFPSIPSDWSFKHRHKLCRVSKNFARSK